MSGLVSTTHAARALGLSQSTLSRWAAAGHIVPDQRTIGGHMRWDLDRLREHLRTTPPPVSRLDAIADLLDFAEQVHGELGGGPFDAEHSDEYVEAVAALRALGVLDHEIGAAIRKRAREGPPHSA